MSVSNILTLNRPMAPRLIQYLYWIALVLIALGVLHGIVGGVRSMTRPLPPVATLDQGAPAPQAPGDTAPGPANAGQMQRPWPGPGHFRGRRHFMMGGPMMRDLTPPVRGSLRILFALLRGLIVLMIIRVLAEVGTAILAMGARQNA